MLYAEFGIARKHTMATKALPKVTTLQALPAVTSLPSLRALLQNPAAGGLQHEVALPNLPGCLLYVPARYATSQAHRSWPAIVFLHGGAESAGMAELGGVAAHGLPHVVGAKAAIASSRPPSPPPPGVEAAVAPSFPIVLISPQCPASEASGWAPHVAALDELADVLLAELRVDRRRVYLSGLSMGGFGTFAWAAASPTRFAALVPICGGCATDAGWAEAIAGGGAATWAFHGANDACVPVAGSVVAVEALKAAGAEAKLTTYSACPAPRQPTDAVENARDAAAAGHDSWTQTYDTAAVYAWMLRHTRPFTSDGPSRALQFTTDAGARMPVDLIFMDCDGIVFDSNSNKTNAYRRTVELLGEDPDGVDAMTALHLADVSVSRFEKFRQFFTEISPKQDVEKYVAKACAKYGDHCMELYKALEPVADAVELARAFGNVAIVSGGAQVELLQVFEAHGIKSAFRSINGSGEELEGGGKKLVHVNRILAETGADPARCLFIGDGWTDFKTAQSAGTHFAFLKQMTDWGDHGEKMAGADPATVSVIESWGDLCAAVQLE